MSDMQNAIEELRLGREAFRNIKLSLAKEEHPITSLTTTGKDFSAYSRQEKEYSVFYDLRDRKIASKPRDLKSVIKTNSSENIHSNNLSLKEQTQESFSRPCGFSSSVFNALDIHSERKLQLKTHRKSEYNFATSNLHRRKRYSTSSPSSSENQCFSLVLSNEAKLAARPLFSKIARLENILRSRERSAANCRQRNCIDTSLSSQQSAATNTDNKPQTDLKEVQNGLVALSPLEKEDSKQSQSSQSMQNCRIQRTNKRRIKGSTEDKARSAYPKIEQDYVAEDGSHKDDISNASFSLLDFKRCLNQAQENINHSCLSLEKIKKQVRITEKEFMTRKVLNDKLEEEVKARNIEWDSLLFRKRSLTDELESKRNKLLETRVEINHFSTSSNELSAADHDLESKVKSSDSLLSFLRLEHTKMAEMIEASQFILNDNDSNERTANLGQRLEIEKKLSSLTKRVSELKARSNELKAIIMQKEMDIESVEDETDLLFRKRSDLINRSYSFKELNRIEQQKIRCSETLSTHTAKLDEHKHLVAKFECQRVILEQKLSSLEEMILSQDKKQVFLTESLQQIKKNRNDGSHFSYRAMDELERLIKNITKDIEVKKKNLKASKARISHAEALKNIFIQQSELCCKESKKYAQNPSKFNAYRPLNREIEHLEKKLKDMLSELEAKNISYIELLDRRNDVLEALANEKLKLEETKAFISRSNNS